MFSEQWKLCLCPHSFIKLCRSTLRIRTTDTTQRYQSDIHMMSPFSTVVLKKDIQMIMFDLLEVLMLNLAKD